MFLKYVLPIVAALLLVVATYHVIHSYAGEPTAAAPIAPTSSPFAHALAASGTVEPCSNQIAIAAPMPGIVAEVFVQPGQHVSAAAPLFRLDDRSLLADLKIREARLAMAKAQLARLEKLPRDDEVTASAGRVGEARANLAAQRSRLERGQRWQKGTLIGTEEVEVLQQGVAAAQAQLARVQAEDHLLCQGAWEADKAVARAALAEAEAFLAQGNTELKRLSVAAPVDATVLQINVRPGESAGNKPDAPPVVLGDIHVLYLRVEIPEEQIGAWRPDAPARATARGQRQPVANLHFVREEPLVAARRFLTDDPRERSDARMLQVIYKFDPGPTPNRVGQQMDVFISTEP
jgi:HlyD family secretion protein